MSGPLVDIIVTTRDNAPVLREALASVEKQTFSDYRCYVVDDCSTDDTGAMVAREFPWVQFIESPTRNGPSKNRNRAIAMGNALFVVTLDDDVVLTPDWLKEMVEFISFSSSIGAVGSQLRYGQEPDKLNGIGGFLGYNGIGAELCFNANLSEVDGMVSRPIRILYACSAATIMRRGAFERAGSFDPSYFYLAEDLDLGIRMNFCGYVVVYNPKAIAYHRYHTTARKLVPKYVRYLYYRNSLLTLVKNFSFLTLSGLLPGFFLRLLWSPLLALQVLSWHLLHFRHVRAWRGLLRERQVVSERQVLAFNSTLLALRLNNSAWIHPKNGSETWKRKLLRALFRLYISVGKRIKNGLPDPRNVHSKYVEHVIFQVTNICNAHCKQCFVLHELNKDVHKNLSLEEIESFFKSLGKVKNIVLGGGEPFLRKDLSRVCILLDQVSMPELITIPTNGAYPDIVFRQVKDTLENTSTSVKISLSLDGPPELHDEIRQVPGLFDQVKKTYEKLSFLYHVFSPRLSLQVNATVFADNFDRVAELRSLAQEQFPLARFTFEAIRGHYDGALAQPISDKEYGELVESMRQLAGAAADEGIKLHELALETLKRQTQVVPCVGGANFIVLDFFGNLYPCEILPRMVNIRDIDYDFRNVLSDPRWTQVIADIQNAKCHCTHMCFLSASLDEVKKKGRRVVLSQWQANATQQSSS